METSEAKVKGRFWATGVGWRAFTLVELLVVIGVVAILASLLLSTLNRGKVAAESTACKSNLRQWGLGLQMYVGDSGAYPAEDTQREDGTDEYMWYERLERYTGEPFRVVSAVNGPSPAGIKTCPAYYPLGGVIAWHQTEPNGSKGRELIYGYGYNTRGFTRDPQPRLGLGGVPFPGSGPLPPIDQVRLTPEGQVVAPSVMIAIGDAELMSLGPPGHFGSLPQLPDAGSRAIIEYLGLAAPQGPIDMFGPAGGWMRRRHGNRWNMAFCDGHAVTSEPRGLFDYHSDVALQHWNSDSMAHRDYVRDLP